MNIRFFLLLLLIVLLTVFGLFSWTAYGYYRAIHSDDPMNPLVRVDIGTAKIIRGDLAIDLETGESYDLETDDALETASESKATIFWPDRSITRLGADTRIVIRKMVVTQDYREIKIAYDIKRGKVWNTVIRLLVGDSYFEVHLPKENIVAGVRGTTFEVNLESGYIHAIRHATALSDISGRVLELFPGELVSSENIWARLGSELLDQSWQEYNHALDAAYDTLRAIDTEARISLLTGKKQLIFIGEWTSSLLSKVEGFEALGIAKSLGEGQVQNMAKYSEGALLEYYQKISGITRGEYRDTLRTTILEKLKQGQEVNPLQILLENAGIWESIDSGKILPSTENLLQGVEGSRDLIQVQYNILKSRLDPETLGNSLSGVVRSLLR